MAKRIWADRWKSAIAQYNQHHNDVDWTVRAVRGDQAPCGCGRRRIGNSTREVICKEFERLSRRIDRLEEFSPWNQCHSDDM